MLQGLSWMPSAFSKKVGLGSWLTGSVCPLDHGRRGFSGHRDVGPTQPRRLRVPRGRWAWPLAVTVKPPAGRYPKAGRVEPLYPPVGQGTGGGSAGSGATRSHLRSPLPGVCTRYARDHQKQGQGRQKGWGQCQWQHYFPRAMDRTRRGLFTRTGPNSTRSRTPRSNGPSGMRDVVESRTGLPRIRRPWTVSFVPSRWSSKPIDDSEPVKRHSFRPPSRFNRHYL